MSGMYWDFYWITPNLKTSDKTVDSCPLAVTIVSDYQSYDYDPIAN
jgi:hypothetical protein